MSSSGLQAAEVVVGDMNGTARIHCLATGTLRFTGPLNGEAKVKAQASAPQQLSTKDSRGQLLFSGGAAGRLNRFSLLKLGSSCFLMEKGQILVSGKQNGCTRSARMSVRGTNYVIDVQDDGSSELSVLEGSVEVETLVCMDATPPA